MLSRTLVGLLHEADPSAGVPSSSSPRVSGLIVPRDSHQSADRSDQTPQPRAPAHRLSARHNCRDDTHRGPIV